MQAYAWTVFPLLISGIWLMKCYIHLRINPKHGATCCVIKIVKHIPTKEQRNSQIRRKIWAGQMLITSHQTAKHSRFDALLSFFFEDNEAVIKMIIIKGRSPTMRHDVGCMDKVFAHVRQTLGRPKEDKMEVDTNALIW